MKKLIISLILFIIIISSGLYITQYFKKSSDMLTKSIEAVSLDVKYERWSAAKSGMEDIQKRWKKTESIWALLTDHIEIDNIEMSMIKSSEYITARSPALSLAELSNLKYMLEHIYEKETFSLENIF